MKFLTISPADLDSEQWLRRCVQIADSIDAPNKPEYLGSLAILGNLVYDSQTILDIISEETMQHPPIVEYAREQGIQQGIKETTCENILDILTFRLQTDVEQTFRPALEAIDDLQHLKQLFQAAMRVETPAEFMQSLNENNE